MTSTHSQASLIPIERNRDQAAPYQERLERLENQLALLSRVISDLILIVGVTNNHVILEDESMHRARIVRDAREVAADIGDLARQMRQSSPG